MSDSQNQLPTPTETPTNTDMMEDDSYPPSPTSYPNHSTTWTPIDTMTPISTNPSRKRSRDESAFESADAEGSYFPSLSSQVNTPAPIPEEPIYGEGMTLLNPQTGMSISAESQTGTWYEEKVAQESLMQEVSAIEAANSFRPKIPASRKSIRLSQSSIKTDFANVVSSATTAMGAGGLHTSAPASPPKTASSCTTSTSNTHPEIDEATLALGIGWSKLSNEDENIQTAARGWARYLENHYARHIHSAEILLKSSGLNAYLVGCQEGFYLFTEDLLEGRLVARDWGNCLVNLRRMPMKFEGGEVLRAERTPGPDGRGFAAPPQTEKMENWADFNRLNNGVVVDGKWIVNGDPGPVLENGRMDID